MKTWGGVELAGLREIGLRRRTPPSGGLPLAGYPLAVERTPRSADRRLPLPRLAIAEHRRIRR